MGKCSIPCTCEFYMKITFLRLNQKTEISILIIFLKGFVAINTTETHTYTHPKNIHTKNRLTFVLRIVFLSFWLIIHVHKGRI